MSSGVAPNSDGAKRSRSRTANNGRRVSESSFCCLSSFGVECSCLLFAIATSNYSIAVQNFYIDRICHVEKNLSWAECRNLTSESYESDEKIVEVIASKYVIYQNVIEYGFPILLSFFLGSWTDKNGSKPILIISLLGYFLSTVLYTVFTLLPDVHPYYILLSSVPVALGGGLTALLIAGVSFITRECSIQERSLRLSALSVCFDGGATLGYYMGEKIYETLGYTEVFFVSAFLCGLSVISAAFLIYETKPETSLDASSSYCRGVTEFFDIRAVKDTVVTCFKKRQNNRRRYIFILMASIILQYLAYSVRTYTYLFSRNMFGWKFEDYSDYVVATSLLNNVGGLLMTLVAIKLLRIGDIYLGLVSSFSNLGGYLAAVFATATTGWFMYLGSGVQIFGAVTTAVMRSLLSKCVDPEEHGKIFSFVTCLELSMPFVAVPLYGVIYMNTAAILPSAIFFVPIAINVVIAMFYIYLHFSMENFIDYSALRGSIDD